VVVDKTNIAAYQKAWEKPESGLRAFYNTQIEATRDHLPATLPDPAKARGGGAALTAAAPAPSWSGLAWRWRSIRRFIA
jgi:hypothetical protein